MFTHKHFGLPEIDLQLDLHRVVWKLVQQFLFCHLFPIFTRDEIEFLFSDQYINNSFLRFLVYLYLNSIFSYNIEKQKQIKGVQLSSNCAVHMTSIFIA